MRATISLFVLVLLQAACSREGFVGTNAGELGYDGALDESSDEGSGETEGEDPIACPGPSDEEPCTQMWLVACRASCDCRDAAPEDCLADCDVSYASCWANAVPSCTERECGPAPMAPTILCEDGQSYAGPGPCVRDAETGLCGFTILECPVVQQPIGCLLPEDFEPCTQSWLVACLSACQCGDAELSACEGECHALWSECDFGSANCSQPNSGACGQ